MTHCHRNSITKLMLICIPLIFQFREEREDLVLLDQLDKRVIKAGMVLMACQADLDPLESLDS